MTNRSTQRILLTAAAVVGILSVYVAIWQPYVLQPKKDRTFLAGMPDEKSVLREFGQPDETIHAGETFTPTGWHPLPGKLAADTSYSFVRPDGRKIYVFFSTNRVIDTFVMSNS